MKIQFLSRRNHFQLLCKELALYNINCNIIDNRRARTFFTMPSNYYINTIDSDLLVSHNPYHGLRGAIKAKKMGKVDNVAFRLKADHWTEQESTDVAYTHRLGYALKKRQYLGSINDVDFVVAISDYIRKVATNHGLDKRTYLMYNGVDIERFHERDFNPRYQSELLCVMNFNIPEKIHLLKEFIEHYREMKLRHNVTVLGDGAFLNQVKTHVKQLGLTKSIIFKGYVKDVEQYYSNCALVIHPSSLESFGMTLLEAGASSKPCVASNVGAIPEILVNNETGYVTDTMYEFVEHIDSLMSDQEKRLRMGKKAKKRVYNNFTWKRVAETFINILREEDLLDGSIYT